MPIFCWGIYQEKKGNKFEYGVLIEGDYTIRIVCKDEKSAEKLCKLFNKCVSGIEIENT